MGFFNIFNSKPVEPVITTDPRPELTVLEDRVEDPEVKEIKGWAKFVGNVRHATVNAKLKLFSVDQEAIKAKHNQVENDRFFMESQHAQEKPLNQIYDTTFRGEPIAVKSAEIFLAKSADEIEAEKLLQVKKGLIKNFAEGRSDEDLKKAIEIQKDKEIVDMYTPVKSYNMSGDQDETGGTRSEKEKKRADRSLSISELQKIKDERKNVPEIKVVNMDAVPAVGRPVSTNENFINDAYELEMKRREQEKNNPIVPVPIVEAKKESPANALIARFKARSAKAFEFVKKEGVKNLDRYNALTPKQKIVVGVAVAGASFATGGSLSIATSTLSVISTARGIYQKEEAKAKALGRKMTEKEKVRSLIKAFSIGSLIGIVAPDVLGSLRDIISFDPSQLANLPNSISVPESMYPTTVMDGADTFLSNTTEVATGVVENLDGTTLINDYVIQDGDSLSKVLLDRAFEGSDLDAKSKITEIYNMFASADGKALLAEAGITDINNIKVGRHIDLKKFTDLLN